MFFKKKRNLFSYFNIFRGREQRKPIDFETLSKELVRDEGVVLHAYKDHLGYQTIGIGRLIDKRRGGGISKEEAEYLLKNDIEMVYNSLSKRIPWMKKLSNTRQRALCNMAFQMGVSGLLKFKNTLSYIKHGDYQKAANNARLSLWHRQTPERAERVIKMILEG